MDALFFEVQTQRLEPSLTPVCSSCAAMAPPAMATLGPFHTMIDVVFSRSYYRRRARGLVRRARLWNMREQPLQGEVGRHRHQPRHTRLGCRPACCLLLLSVGAGRLRLEHVHGDVAQRDDDVASERELAEDVQCVVPAKRLCTQKTHTHTPKTRVNTNVTPARHSAQRSTPIERLRIETMARNAETVHTRLCTLIRTNVTAGCARMCPTTLQNRSTGNVPRRGTPGSSWTPP